MVRKTCSKISLLLIALSSVIVAPVFAQDSAMVIPLWKNGAPGFENLKNQPEQAKDWWVRNINNPSITVFFPPTNGILKQTLSHLSC